MWFLVSYVAHYTTAWPFIEVTFVNVTLVEAGPSGRGPAVVEEVSKKKIPISYNIFFYETSSTGVIK